MKKTIILLTLFIGLLQTSSLILPSSVYAGYVNGYYRSNGTYVNGYYRTEADGNPYNNYSTPGNYNPNTGTITGGSLDSYIDRYYNRSSSGSSYGSYSNTYSVPSTPTCPSLATYDSISGSCKCMSGYIVDSTGSSCISGSSYCWNKMGYGSSYDSLSKSCSCDSGYKIDNTGQCVSNSTYCTNTYGYGSEYSYLKSQCVCKSGYTADSTGSRCVYTSSNYSYSTYTNSYASSPDISTCPSNSHQSSTNPDKCDCNSGYQVNQNKDACTPNVEALDKSCKTFFGSNSKWDSIKSTCIDKEVSTLPSSGIVSNVSNGDTCKTSYGEGSRLIGKLCYCAPGYQWNTPVSQCIKSPIVLSTNLKIGATGIEVVILKNFLANQGLYSDKVNTPYDSATFSAVSKFQNQNGIPSTGTVGPMTRLKINQLMLSN